MFRVENADFIAEKLEEELPQHQEQREVYKNGEEAIIRRLLARESEAKGRIEFDVDWHMLGGTGHWYLCCADNGDGMTRSELEKYSTTLAVEGANQNQSITGNQGMGLKIAAVVRNKEGILIRSMKDGEATMVQIGHTGSEYDLIPLGDSGKLIETVSTESFPEFIQENGAGTVVTFLGNQSGDNTFRPPRRARGWLFKYLNQRLFRVDDEVELLVRVPSGDEDEWPQSLPEADDRQRGEGGKSFNLSRVRGTGYIWDTAADAQAPDFKGIVELPGDPSEGIPGASMHWWVLPSGEGSDVSSRTNSGGSIAVLFQNELHDWRVGGQANSFFARMGVRFGKSRIGFVLEPTGEMISSDFARAHVLVGGEAVFESDAWLLWADQFRDSMPEKIRETMDEEREALQKEDPDQVKRINERLKEVMSLLRPRKFRKDQGGKKEPTGPEVAGPGDDPGSVPDVVHKGPGKRPRTGGRRGIGSVLAQADLADEETVSEVPSSVDLHPRWINENQANLFPIVSGGGEGLHDRAAALSGEDGVTATDLLLNLDFRGYQTIVTAVNDANNPDGDDDLSQIIEREAQEWIAQKMIESVNGLRQLENGSTWTTNNFDDALSPVALTAAFMADRYHTLQEVKRKAGSFRSTSRVPATKT